MRSGRGFAWARVALLGAALLGAAVFGAQSAEAVEGAAGAVPVGAVPVGEGRAGEGRAGEGLPSALVAPTLVHSTAPVFPAALREQGPFAGEARVLLTVDETGRVSEVVGAGADHALFDAALQAVVGAWRFEPARLEGERVAVQLPVVWRFTAPPVPVRGRLSRRGVRGPVVGVAVVFEPVAGAGQGEGGRSIAEARLAVSAAEGAFAVEVPPGEYTLRVDDPAVMPHAAPLEVRGVAVDVGEIALTPSPSFDDAVQVRARRSEGSTRLDARELASTAGSLGDPLRVLQSLPSVGTYLSLIPFPIVRGTPTGETGIAVDGTRLPMMFHSAVGMSVIPPQLIDGIEFHPGIAPLRFGRFTGAAIEAFTRDPVTVGWMGEASVDVAQASGLLSVPLGEHGRITAAGRTSYANWLLEALDQPLALAFDDYHLRSVWKWGRRQVRASLFGATDEFGDRGGALTTMAFHRLALRWMEPVGSGGLEVALDLGLDRLGLPGSGRFVVFRGAGGGVDVVERLVNPRVIFTQGIGAWGLLEVGVEGVWQEGEFVVREGGERLEGPASGPGIGPGIGQESVQSVQEAVGAWAEVRIERGPVTVTPGVRVDVYSEPMRWSLDPRVDARWALGDETALIGRVGLMSGPQRYDWPIPGAGSRATGTLQAARQGSFGVEQGLGAGLELAWSAFASQVHGLPDSGIDRARPASFDEEVSGIESEESEHARRVRGMDVLLRRRAGEWWSGWVAYTLQRVERLDREGRWVPGALEQNHLLNVVLTLRLPDRWTVGGRFHYASGRPVDAGSYERLDGYAQLDLRVEKQWIADAFELVAYLDVVNVTRAAEETRQETALTAVAGEGEPTIDLFLPMLGVRARF